MELNKSNYHAACNNTALHIFQPQLLPPPLLPSTLLVFWLHTEIWLYCYFVIHPFKIIIYSLLSLHLRDTYNETSWDPASFTAVLAPEYIAPP